jgi:Ca2+-binding RTX toxin-like protein
MAKVLTSTGSPATASRLPPCASIAVEALEDRRHWSVTVSQGWTGYFTIQGTPADDTINVSVNRAAATMTVEGTTYTGVQYINVIAGDGADTVQVSGTGSGSVACSIDGGAGNDTISLNFDGGIWGGSGDDTVTLSDAFRGYVQGDDGADFITVLGNCVNAEIHGGDGPDGIDASGNHYGVVADGGTGNDVVIGSQYDDELYGGAGTDYVDAQGGNDIIYVQDSGFNDYVWGGSGYDTMYGDVNDIIWDNSVEVVYRY